MNTEHLSPQQKGLIEKALRRGERLKTPPVLFTDCSKPNPVFMAACAD